MKKTTKLSISTPIGKNFESNDVVIANIDIAEGRIGMMPNQSPLVSSIKICIFNVEFSDGSKKEGVIAGGIANVTPKEITLLATDFDWIDKIDFDQAQNNIKNITYQLQSPVSKIEEKSLHERIKYNELKMSFK